MTITEKYIKVKKQTIFTRQYTPDENNNNPTIVLLHEALGCTTHWRNFPEKLAAKTNSVVLLYDRLGHGLSEPMTEPRGVDYLHKEAWEILPSVLKSFKIKKPILLGHSDGGTIALLYAARFETHAIITEAAHVFVEPITVEGINKALPQKAVLIEKLGKYHGIKTEALFNAWSDTWLDIAFQTWNIETFLQKIHCPALIIQGDMDEYGTFEQVKHIEDGIGENAEACIIENCGHTPHKEAEDIVLEKIAVFINEVV